jgi:predicted AAA+ superfamily ATPase
MNRDYYLKQIKTSFKNHPVVALLGARQVGKSTLSREFQKSFKGHVHFFDLEDPIDLARLETPKLTLESLSGLIIIDEIQRRPELFPTLRVLADKNKKVAKYLILGSASRELLQQSSESLAGRIAYIEVRPFSVIEKIDLKRLWLRGGYPKAYLAKKDVEASLWLKNYIATFLERDIPQLGFQIPPQTLRRFWLMLTHYHAGIFNGAEIGSALGASGQTVRRYLDILTQTYMIRELQPWHANIDKRQIKSPKIYFRDTGLLHQLMSLNNEESLMNHPKLGASWEGFVVEQISAHLDLNPEELFFWGTHSNAELDLLTFIDGHPVGFEIKYTDAPKITKSMQIACDDLKLKHIFVFYPGPTNYKINEKITAIGLKNITQFSP